VGKDPNPVILNVVSTIDTIRVQFFLTENYYLAYARDAARIDSLKSDRRVNDRQVDPTTGCILLQASFPNPEKILRPGQFARIKGLIYIEDNALLVPQRCLSEIQGKYSLYIVNDSNKVERRDVETGLTVDSFWVITKGISQGEKVVYEGIQQVREGMTIKPEIVELNEKGQKK
jgi:membrane fusion protein (multidrug efflux system)